MYMNIDFDDVSNGLKDADLTNIQRVQQFNKVANIIKLRSGFTRDNQNFIVYRDEVFSYVHLHSSAIVSSNIFGRVTRGLYDAVTRSYEDNVNREYTYLLCIPNSIMDAIIFDKVINVAETIKRKYNFQNNLSADHIHTTAEQNHFFFEALLSNGIDTTLYMYNVDLKWSYTVFTYTQQNKETGLHSICKGQNSYLGRDDIESNNTGIALSKIMKHIHSDHRDVSMEDCAVAFYLSKSTHIYNTISKGIAHRQLLLCNDCYDFYEHTRRAVIQCMT